MRDILGLIGKRLTSVQEEHLKSNDKFRKIEKEFPYDLGPSALGKDEEIDKAFESVEEIIKNLKIGDVKDPKTELKRMQMKNKMGYLMGMLN